MAPRRNGRALAVATAPVRCAIYTRKSTDEGLDRDFNSLDAQRELAEAYITSQRTEGWIALPDRFDDGGYTGANTNRPALNQLLVDVEAGKIDCVVVYRYDRVSRNLLDFLQLMEFLKKHDVAFVSVSERFDTSTPHGEMALNMVLSVAQCERKIIGQRTRDKLGAARRRGKFVGGHPFLGYDLDGGRLVVNEVEADTVRQIFQLFLEQRSLVGLAAELNRRSWTMKAWTTLDGKTMGGGRFTRVNVHRLLTNHAYVGKVEFQGEIYDGEHDAIVPQKVFRDVQRILADNRSTGGATQRNRHGALLRDLLRCTACSRAMTHAPTRAHGRLYRYYRCQGAQKNGHDTCPTRSVSADKIERFVVDQIRRIGADPALQQATFEQAVAQVKAKRRGLKLEGKRLADELSRGRADVERLVATVSRVAGDAADAVAAELAKAQERVRTIETRRAEVATETAALDTQDIDRDAVARALVEFDELWGVLLTPERERVLRLLIDHIGYDGGTGKLDIHWQLAGFKELATEVNGGAP